jgi:hypothetical protein
MVNIVWLNGTVKSPNHFLYSTPAKIFQKLD